MYYKVRRYLVKGKKYKTLDILEYKKYLLALL